MMKNNDSVVQYRPDNDYEQMVQTFTTIGLAAVLPGIWCIVTSMAPFAAFQWFGFAAFLKGPKTRNRMRVAIQSVCVTKILALQRWSKIDFPPEFQTRQMHSFPIMYNTMGSKVDGLAVRDHFLPKNGLKTAILGEQIRHRLTSEGAGTQIFKGIANFSMCFKKCGTLSSK